jgi:hypothetical protein
MVSWKKMYKECEYELEYYRSVFESCTAFLREIIEDAFREAVESELGAWVEVVMNILYDVLPKMLAENLENAAKNIKVDKIDDETLDTIVDLFVDSVMVLFEEYAAGEIMSRLEETIEPIADEITERLIKKGVFDNIAKKLLEDQRIKRVYEECRKAISEY